MLEATLRFSSEFAKFFSNRLQAYAWCNSYAYCLHCRFLILSWHANKKFVTLCGYLIYEKIKQVK